MLFLETNHAVRQSAGVFVKPKTATIAYTAVALMMHGTSQASA